VFPGEKERSDGLGRKNSVDDAGSAAVCDDGAPAIFIGDAHGLQFCFHAAAAAAVSAASIASDAFREGVDLWDERGAFALGVVSIQAVDVGKKNEKIGIDMGHDQSGKLVIISKDAGTVWYSFGSAGGADEFRGGNGIIFVDHGNHAKLEQSGERGSDFGR
jgi:hypothetical protein